MESYSGAFPSSGSTWPVHHDKILSPDESPSKSSPERTRIAATSGGSCPVASARANKLAYNSALKLIEILASAKVARFGTARDLTLGGLRVELVFPRDEVVEAFFRRSAQSVQ